MFEDDELLNVPLMKLPDLWLIRRFACFQDIVRLCDVIAAKIKITRSVVKLEQENDKFIFNVSWLDEGEDDKVPDLGVLSEALARVHFSADSLYQAGLDVLLYLSVDMFIEEEIKGVVYGDLLDKKKDLKSILLVLLWRGRYGAVISILEFAAVLGEIQDLNSSVIPKMASADFAKLRIACNAYALTIDKNTFSKKDLLARVSPMDAAQFSRYIKGMEIYSKLTNEKPGPK